MNKSEMKDSDIAAPDRATDATSKTKETLSQARHIVAPERAMDATSLTSGAPPSSVELVSGNEAVARAAFDAGVSLGTGYPGTPATEILEAFDALGGRAQWAPNEKVGLEVALGVSLAGARSIVTMKHVGLNVAADPLFTAAYLDVPGALVVVSADEPGMSSSQNEQDNRRYAVAAGVAMLEPSDSQEAYEFTLRAIEIAERWQKPVMLRLTTRVCHSKTVLRRGGALPIPPPRPADYTRNIPGRVMIPGYARPAHKRLRTALAQIAAWNETADVNRIVDGSPALGIVTSGISYQHVREAAPEARVLKLGMTYPLPFELIRRFVSTVERAIVIEEGDPYLVEAVRAAGISVEGKAEMFRLGELNVSRVRRILAGDLSPEPALAPGKPPALCPGCGHRSVFSSLRNLDCIVSGDIGCYTLAVLPPFEAVDSCVCMGASIGVGLGLRHALPPEQAKRVVSVIGDSTFFHSGITGLVEMVYNPPPTGHVVLVLDNGTTAMTGFQEHPGTGRTLDHSATAKVTIEGLARAIGVRNVHVIDPTLDPAAFERLVKECLDKPELTVIVARRDCLLAARTIREYERMNARCN
jgi:indolepyruvate ferredoxin oxidoreductase alpha subunit